MTQKLINDLSYRIIGCAIEVHRHLGPGLLESVYHSCMMDELVRNDFSIQSHVAVPIFYKGKTLAEPLRLDLLVEDLIVVELKAISVLADIHFAIVRSYLKAAGLEHGLLLNFATMPLTIKRVILQSPALSASS